MAASDRSVEALKLTLSAAEALGALAREHPFLNRGPPGIPAGEPATDEPDDQDHDHQPANRELHTRTHHAWSLHRFEFHCSSFASL
jgi:hypothetical protein